MWRRQLAQRLKAGRWARTRDRTLVRGALRRWHAHWQSESGPGSGSARVRGGPGLIREAQDFMSSSTESRDGTSSEPTWDGEGTEQGGHRHCGHFPAIPQLRGPYRSPLTSPNLSLLICKMGIIVATSSEAIVGIVRPSRHHVWLRNHLLVGSSSHLLHPHLHYPHLAFRSHGV